MPFGEFVGTSWIAQNTSHELTKVQAFPELELLICYGTLGFRTLVC